MQTQQRDNLKHGDEATALKHWLSSLPALDPADNLQQIQKSLQKYSTVKMSAADRLALLDCYQDSIKQLMRDLQKYLVGLMLPLPQASLSTSDSIRNLLQQYAHGYLIVVYDCIDNAQTLDSGADRYVLVKACHAAMRSLSELLRSSYESYREIPAGTWRRLHKILRLARTYEIEAEYLSNDSRAAGSIGSEYKRALLLGLSEPYQLPFRAVNFVFDQLQRWAPQAKLADEIEQNNSSACLFVVDTHADLPAIPCLSPGKMQRRERDLLLDTSALVAALNFELKTMVGNTVTDAGADAGDFVQMATIKALITHWGAHPMRRNQRSASRAKYASVVGLRNVSQALVEDSEGSTPCIHLEEASDTLRGTFGQQQHQKTIARALADPWETVDESLNGFRCRVKSSEGTQAQVGELVALRPETGKKAWQVGIIRWAKENADSTFGLGIYKLGEKVVPVRVRIAADEDQNTLHNDQGGLFLPADPSIKREQTLIVPNGLYRPKRLLWIRSNSARADYIVEVANLILAGRPFDWFEIRLDRAYGLNRGTVQDAETGTKGLSGPTQKPVRDNPY